MTSSDITFLSEMGGRGVIVTAPYDKFLLYVTGWNSTINAETPTCTAKSGSSTITRLWTTHDVVTRGTYMHTSIFQISTTSGNTLEVYSTGNNASGYAQIIAIRS